MTNLNILETFRTKKELLNYFDEIGQNITDKEIEALKQNYEQEENINALTLQQLDEVAGGVYGFCYNIADPGLFEPLKGKLPKEGGIVKLKGIEYKLQPVRNICVIEKEEGGADCSLKIYEGQKVDEILNSPDYLPFSSNPLFSEINEVPNTTPIAVRINGDVHKLIVGDLGVMIYNILCKITEDLHLNLVNLEKNPPSDDTEYLQQLNILNTIKLYGSNPRIFSN